MKITMEVVYPELMAKAVSLAEKYMNEWLPESGPRPLSRNAMAVTTFSGMSFWIWGTEQHVRIRQEGCE